MERARRVEGAGFATFQVSDHFARSPAAPLLALGATAQVTTTLRLGTLVLANDFLHPAVLAKELATLDFLCDGRLEVGLGAGWMDTDYAVSGIAFDPLSRCIDRLDETVGILTDVLTGGRR